MTSDLTPLSPMTAGSPTDTPLPGARYAGKTVAGEPHDLPNPSTGATLARVGWVDASVVDDVVTATATAMDEWASTPARTRAAALRGIATSIRERAEELGTLVMAETGKRRQEAVGEAMFSALYFDWFADAATMPQEQHLVNDQRRFVVGRQPVGVVAAVSPWNFPLSIPARKVAPALAAGCTVVQKPSELTPLSSLLLTEICEPHLPSGAVSIMVGDGAALTSALVDHPDVAAVSFTGSTRVGALVAERAMRSMTRVTMELGGQAPFVVCADADPEVALESLLVAKFRNNGASCIAANNVFVHDSQYDGLVSRLREQVTAMRVGDPGEPDTDLGPMLRPDHVRRLDDLVGQAASVGCRVTAGSVPESGGWFAAPRLVEISEDADLWRQEIFGPVLAVRRFSDEDAVVDEVNGWRVGLGGYVVSRDVQAAVDLARRMRIGIVGVNNGAPNTPEVPFGGFGLSGLGREGSLEGMLEFTESQTVSVAR